MRHQKKGRKLGRKKNQRKALLKSLATNLIMKEKIITTEARAKALKPVVERLVTYAKKGGQRGFRMVLRFVFAGAAQKLVQILAPRYQGRNGGYTRTVKLPRRAKDAAKRMMIEFVI